MALSSEYLSFLLFASFVGVSIAAWRGRNGQFFKTFFQKLARFKRVNVWRDQHLKKRL